MNARICVCTIFVIAELLGISSAEEPKLATESQASEASQIISKFDALKINNMAVESCDVLYWTEVISDKGEAGYESIRKITRLVLDLEKQQCLQIELAKREFLNIDENPAEGEGKNEPIRGQSLILKLIDRDNLTVREWPGLSYSKKVEGGFFECLLGIPTFHFVGICEFPISAAFLTSSDRGIHPLGNAQEFWGLYKMSWAKGVLVRSFPNLLIKIGPKTNSQTGITTYYEHTLNDDTSLPMRRASYLVNGEERKPYRNEFVKWKEEKGLYLPIEIQNDKLGQVRFGDEERLIEYEQNEVHTIVWLSVNEELSEADFGKIKSQDSSAVLKLLDPDLVGVGDQAPWEM